jgi:hypothetical protein
MHRFPFLTRHGVNTGLRDTRRRLCNIGFMTAANKIRVWYVVMALSAITIVVPLFAAGLWGEKLKIRYFVFGPIMIAAALYELRVLRRRV